jgi:hypothetical protein
MAGAPWTAADEQRIRRWAAMGKRPAEIRLYLGVDRRTLAAVERKMSDMGLLERANPNGWSEAEAAKSWLKREVALARAEMETGRVAPYKGRID